MSNNNDDDEKKQREIVPFWRSGFDELDRVFDNFKRDFEDIFAPSLSFGGRISPRLFEPDSTTCDIVDEGDKFVVTADMPRMKKEEISINVGDDYIDISAEHKESEEEKKKKYVRKEHRETSIHRRLSIPERVKPSDVKAKLTNGILTVELPKEKPTPQPKSTKIKVE